MEEKPIACYKCIDAYFDKRQAKVSYLIDEEWCKATVNGDRIVTKDLYRQSTCPDHMLFVLGEMIIELEKRQSNLDSIMEDHLSKHG